MKLHRFKNLLSEIYFIVSVVYYWVLTGTLLNLLAIALLITLGVIIWLKNRLLGVATSAVILVLNLLLILALVSELSEFETFDKNAMVMLVVGLAYIGLNIFMSLRMLIKWTAMVRVA